MSAIPASAPEPRPSARRTLWQLVAILGGAFLLQIAGAALGLSVPLRMALDGSDDGVAMAAAELQRHRLERFSVLLSTIITASPMIGILGTVIGIIKSFNVLGAQTQLADPRGVSGGIGEALITTACGLAVALVTLFPYMSFKGLADRAMGRMESVIAAAQTGMPRRPAPRAAEPVQA